MRWSLRVFGTRYIHTRFLHLIAVDPYHHRHLTYTRLRVSCLHKHSVSGTTLFKSFQTSRRTGSQLKMATITSASAGLSLSAERPKNIETQHEDMVHDAQLDFYGKRLATCSSDRTVKVFDIINGTPSTNAETLHGHQGPVWQVAWAHPTFGDILASCSYDGKVIIWKDNGAGAPNSASAPYSAQHAYGASTVTAGGWTKIKEHTLHTASGAYFLLIAE